MRRNAAALAFFGMALAVVAGDARAQGRAGPDAPGQQVFEEGMKAFDADDFATAQAKFTRAIAQNDKLTDAYWHLAAIYYRNRQYAQAVALLRRSPDQANLDVREQLGLNLFKTATPPPVEAVQLLESVVAQRPEAFAAEERIGEYYLRSAPAKSVVALEAYLRSRPSAAASLDGQVRMLLATAQLYARDWDAAEQGFIRLRQERPGESGPTLMLGTVYVGKKDCARAVPLLEAVRGQAETQPTIRYNLAGCYLKMHRMGEAEKEAKAYAKARPKEGRAHQLLGDVLVEQRDFAGAATAYNAGVQAAPDDDGLRVRLARAQLAGKNYGAAISTLREVLARSPNNLDAQAVLLEASVATNAPWERIEPTVRSLTAATRSATAQSAVGHADYVHGHDAEAEVAYHNVLRIEPTNKSATTRLVLVLNHRAVTLLTGAADVDPQAEADLNEAQRLLPDDFVTLHNAGVLQLVRKHYAEAEVVFTQLARRAPNDATMHRLLGRALAAQLKSAPAIVEYERAQQLAQKVGGAELAGIDAELGPLYVDGDKLDSAVTVLDQGLKEAEGAGPADAALIPVLQRNVALAHLRRGLARLRDAKRGEEAYTDLARALEAPKSTLVGKELAAADCGEGFAALATNRIGQAQEGFSRALALGGCALRPPYDRLGLGFFAAYAAYRDAQSPAKREGSIRTFTQLSSKTAGVTLDWLRQLLRSAYELTAFDVYQRNDGKRAELLLRNASKVPAKGERRTLDHNMAVIDLQAGRLAVAERVLEGLNGRPAEALVNLGILRDRQGDAKRALDLYRKALEKGAHAPKLKEWIDIKERLFEARP